MVKSLLAAAVILLVLVTWIGVDRAYRAFAQRHPELGPFRAPGGGCGGGCRCSGGQCRAD